MTQRLLSDDDVRERLRSHVEKAGNQLRLSRQVGVSSSTVCMALSGRAPATGKLLASLGLECVGRRYVERETRS